MATSPAPSTPKGPLSLPLSFSSSSRRVKVATHNNFPLTLAGSSSPPSSTPATSVDKNASTNSPKHNSDKLMTETEVLTLDDSSSDVEIKDASDTEGDEAKNGKAKKDEGKKRKGGGAFSPSLFHLASGLGGTLSARKTRLRGRSLSQRFLQLLQALPDGWNPF